MAWSTPRTWVAGAVLTAAQLNADTRDNSTILKTSINNSGHLEFVDATELTISSGVITVTQNFHKIDTQSAASSDDLDTITAGTNVAAGFILHLRVESGARTVVLKDGTGGSDNLDLGADVTLDETHKTYALVYDGANWRPWLFVAAGASVDVQEFSASGTWTKPTSATLVYVFVINSGGGGGSGRRGATESSNRAYSGGSGAGGAGAERWLLASDCGATETVTVDSGGAGGVAQTSDSTGGNNGGPSVASSFGSLLQPGVTGQSYGSGGLTGASDSVEQNDGGPSWWGTAGRGSSWGAGDAGQSPRAPHVGGCGGSNGGGITSTTTTAAGGVGGGWDQYERGNAVAYAGGTAGADSGGAGGNGASVPLRLLMGGTGGGGGGSDDAGTGGAGGAGSAPGGGGGGGGASGNGNNSGAGGAGGAGYCIVITWP